MYTVQVIVRYLMLIMLI